MYDKKTNDSVYQKNEKNRNNVARKDNAPKEENIADPEQREKKERLEKVRKITIITSGIFFLSFIVEGINQNCYCNKIITVFSVFLGALYIVVLLCMISEYEYLHRNNTKKETPKTVAPSPVCIEANETELEQITCGPKGENKWTEEKPSGRSKTVVTTTIDMKSLLSKKSNNKRSVQISNDDLADYETSGHGTSVSSCSNSTDEKIVRAVKLLISEHCHKPVNTIQTYHRLTSIGCENITKLCYDAGQRFGVSVEEYGIVTVGDLIKSVQSILEVDQVDEDDECGDYHEKEILKLTDYVNRYKNEELSSMDIHVLCEELHGEAEKVSEDIVYLTYMTLLSAIKMEYFINAMKRGFNDNPKDIEDLKVLCLKQGRKDIMIVRNHLGNDNEPYIISSIIYMLYMFWIENKRNKFCYDNVKATIKEATNDFQDVNNSLFNIEWLKDMFDYVYNNCVNHCTVKQIDSTRFAGINGATPGQIIENPRFTGFDPNDKDSLTVGKIIYAIILIILMLAA